MILRFWVTLVNDFYKLISYLKFYGTSLLGSVTNYNLIEEKTNEKIEVLTRSTVDWF